MLKKLPPALEGAVLDRIAHGATSDQVAEWLKVTHDVHVSGAAIRKRLMRLRSESADVTKSVVREQLAKSVLSDLQILEREAVRLEGIATKALAEGTPDLETYFKAHDRIVKVADTRLHYSGAGVPDGPTDELATASERLRGRMDRLAAAGRT